MDERGGKLDDHLQEFFVLLGELLLILHELELLFFQLVDLAILLVNLSPQVLKNVFMVS